MKNIAITIMALICLLLTGCINSANTNKNILKDTAWINIDTVSCDTSFAIDDIYRYKYFCIQEVNNHKLAADSTCCVVITIYAQKNYAIAKYNY